MRGPSLALAGQPHATDDLSVLTSFCALVMGVTLSAIMREQGPELAMLGLVCRVIEGMAGEGMTLAWMTPSPMFGFEVALALWFTARGMNAPPAAPLLNG